MSSVGTVYIDRNIDRNSLSLPIQVVRPRRSVFGQVYPPYQQKRHTEEVVGFCFPPISTGSLPGYAVEFHRWKFERRHPNRHREVSEEYTQSHAIHMP
jgi:hypothetical protein